MTQLIQPFQSRLHVSDSDGNPSGYLIRFFQQITSVLNGGNAGLVAPNVAKVTIGTGTNIFSGAGSPEALVPANIGDIYSNTSGGAGTTLYVKATGASGSNVGWTALA